MARSVMGQALLVSGIGTVLILGALWASADQNGQARGQQPVTVDELPDPVRNTLREQTAGGELREVSVATYRDGTRLYEANMVREGRQEELKVTTGGEVVCRQPATTER